MESETGQNNWPSEADKHCVFFPCLTAPEQSRLLLTPAVLRMALRAKFMRYGWISIGKAS